MSNNEDGVKMVRYGAAQIEHLCPQVINAARILAARPKSKVCFVCVGGHSSRGFEWSNARCDIFVYGLSVCVFMLCACCLFRFCYLRLLRRTWMPLRMPGRTRCASLQSLWMTSQPLMTSLLYRVCLYLWLILFLLWDVIYCYYPWYSTNEIFLNCCLS